MEDLRFEPAFKHIFTQFMRYTQLKQVVSEVEYQNQFFDRLSELPFCNQHILFWLQWSLAMRENGDYPQAEQYWNKAYARAEKRDNFATSHPDDKKARLILESARPGYSSINYYRYFSSVYQLLMSGIRRGEPTSHNYETIEKSFNTFFDNAIVNLSGPHRSLIVEMLDSLDSLAQRKIDVQLGGFIKAKMPKANEVIQFDKQRLKKI